MVRDVCSGYTGTKKEYYKSGCTKCEYYSFYDGDGYEPNGYYCKIEDTRNIKVIPFEYTGE